MRLSSAFVVVRGGIGTTLEALMVWQLLQVRHVHDTPFIFVGDMWKGLVDWSKTHMLGGERNLAAPEDVAIPYCAANVDEAVERIRQHKARFDAAPSG